MPRPTTKPATKKPVAKKAVAKKPAAAKTSTSKTSVSKKVPVAKKSPVAGTGAVERSPKEIARALAPFFLLPPEETSTGWTLCLTDGESPADVFEEEGHSGNGYSWEALALSVMKAMPRKTSRSITFDSEAGTFVAMCGKPEPLLVLGEALVTLLRDEKSLRKAIRAVPESAWDD